MFWLLLGLASTAFLPAVIAPVWRDRMAWRQRQAALESEVQTLRERSEHNHMLIDRLMNDPAANERLAIRELGVMPPGEKLVQVRIDTDETLPAYATPPKKPEVEANVPDVVMQLSRKLPDVLEHPAFLESPRRELLLLLSGGLTVAAFALYRPR